MPPCGKGGALELSVERVLVTSKDGLVEVHGPATTSHECFLYSRLFIFMSNSALRRIDMTILSNGPFDIRIPGTYQEKGGISNQVL